MIYLNGKQIGNQRNMGLYFMKVSGLGMVETGLGGLNL